MKMDEEQFLVLLDIRSELKQLNAHMQSILAALKKEPPPYKYQGQWKEHVPKILSMHRKGCSARDISAALPALVRPWGGQAQPIDLAMVRYILRNYGEVVETPGRHNFDERDRDILNLYDKDGKTLKEIANTFGISSARVYQIVH